MFDPIKQYVIYILAGLLAALALTYGIHTTFLKAEIKLKEGTIQEQNGKIITLEANVATLTETNLKMATEINTQNIAIQGYVDAAGKAKAESDRALAAAKAEGDVWKRRYRSILSDPPQHPDDLCLSLSERLDTYVAQRKGEPQ